MRRSGIICALLALWTASGTYAQFAPNERPTLEISRASGSIVVDGQLGDDGWRDAARTDRWQQTWPGYNTEPAFAIEGWMTYDEEKLYIAIVVSEDDPSTLRASRSDRDAIWRDDYVGLIFDTYGSGAWAYELFVNPFGIQGDLRWTPEGEDMGFDLIWETEGHIRDDGWQVEIAVPFQSLRFPDRAEQVWRGTFWYNRPRESRLRYSWSAADRDNPCWTCTWGSFRGISQVSAGGALELLPSITAYRQVGLESDGDPSSEFGERESDADVGINLRYGISSSVSAEAAINPDFSQVESDAAQIDANTTFALFYPERRPFFQEGSDLFGSWISAVYTRSINDPLWAAKLTGRTERSSVALLVGRDENSPLVLPFEERSRIFALGRSTSAIGRARRAFFEDSFVGALVTFRDYDDGGRNFVFGADSRLRFLDNYSLETQWLLSDTDELNDPGFARSAFVDPDTDELLRFGTRDDQHTQLLDGESFSGQAGVVRLNYGSRFWSWNVEWSRISPTFRADNGFITRNDSDHLFWWNGGSIQANNSWLEEIRPIVMFGRVWNLDGRRKDEWIRGELNVDFKGQTGFELGWLTSNENFGGQQVDGIQRGNVDFESRFSEYVNLELSYERGSHVVRRAEPPELGHGESFAIDVNIRPITQLSIEPALEWVRLEDLETGSIDQAGYFEGYVTRTRLNYQFNRSLLLRLVLQYDDFDRELAVEPLITFRVNPFTVFYAGTAHRVRDFGTDDFGDGLRDYGFEETDRLYFAKFQYFFRN